MAKFYGQVGYTVSHETSPGIFEEEIIEHDYSGEILQNYKKNDNGEGPIDNIQISNRISFIADPYAYDHFHAIKYVKWRGISWKVSAVTVEYPRLILTIGSVYNGPAAELT